MKAPRSASQSSSQTGWRGLLRPNVTMATCARAASPARTADAVPVGSRSSSGRSSTLALLRSSLQHQNWVRLDNFSVFLLALGAPRTAGDACVGLTRHQRGNASRHVKSRPRMAPTVLCGQSETMLVACATIAQDAPSDDGSGGQHLLPAQPSSSHPPDPLQVSRELEDRTVAVWSVVLVGRGRTASGRTKGRVSCITGRDRKNCVCDRMHSTMVR